MMSVAPGWKTPAPAAESDVASHYYSYSFERNDYFSDYYARQPQLYDYFRTLLTDHDIEPHVTFEREVVRAVWDDTSATWTITARRPDGAQEVRTANALICGVGILNRPLILEIPGMAEFDGPLFHSARWDHSLDLTGKRVALLGAGASGFQIGSAIVKDVAALTVFQRTPQWMAPNPRYHAEVTTGSGGPCGICPATRGSIGSRSCGSRTTRCSNLSGQIPIGPTFRARPTRPVPRTRILRQLDRRAGRP